MDTLAAIGAMCYRCATSQSKDVFVSNLISLGVIRSSLIT
jgi:hypothetical protein